MTFLLATQIEPSPQSWCQFRVMVVLTSCWVSGQCRLDLFYMNRGAARRSPRWHLWNARLFSGAGQCSWPHAFSSQMCAPPAPPRPAASLFVWPRFGPWRVGVALLSLRPRVAACTVRDIPQPRLSRPRSQRSGRGFSCCYKSSGGRVFSDGTTIADKPLADVSL